MNATFSKTNPPHFLLNPPFLKWIRHKNCAGFIFNSGGFINKSALFIFSRWMPHFQKRMRPIFNWIRHVYHESATFFPKKSRLPLLDMSKIAFFGRIHFTDLAYSCVFNESAMLHNESAMSKYEYSTKYHVFCGVFIFLHGGFILSGGGFISFPGWLIFLQRVRHVAYMNPPS